MLEGSAQGVPQRAILGMATAASHQLDDQSKVDHCIHPREPWFLFSHIVQPFQFTSISKDHSLQEEKFFSPTRLEAAPAINSSSLSEPERY